VFCGFGEPAGLFIDCSSGVRAALAGDGPRPASDSGHHQGAAIISSVLRRPRILDAALTMEVKP
jgi:hypothetical protein